jgi:hypothetical protein
VLNAGTYPASRKDYFFPALHELVERRVQRRRILFTITAESADGRGRMQDTQFATWMGSGEWLDERDDWRYVPAFVNPNDPAVAELVAEAVTVLRTITDSNDDFDGYERVHIQPQSPSRQLQAIFQTLRDARSGIRYATPLGSPIFEPGSTFARGQIVRSHAEVLGRRIGTCHDLSVLLAAAAEHVRILPLVIMVRGHTFVGFWLSGARQREFWNGRRGPEPQHGTLFDGARLKNLVDDQIVELVDAVGLCKGWSYDKARAEGAARLTRALEAELPEFDVAVDVFEARRAGVQPV